jgi:transcriptional regulator with XRE-family HTH domain
MDERLLVGALMKAGRRTRRVRQSFLADELGYSSAALSHVEAGKNRPSDEMLEVYARHLAAPGQAELLVRLLSDPESVRPEAVAELITPEDPAHFLAMFKEVTTKYSRRNSGERLSSGFRSSSRQWSSRGEPSSKETLERVVSALQDHLQNRGGKVVLPGRDMSDFGTGFPISSDLIELTDSLVIDVKVSPVFNPRWVPAAIGNALLLREHGFRFALCVTSPPDFRGRDDVVRALRKYDVQLMWARVDIDDDGLIADIKFELG